MEVHKTPSDTRAKQVSRLQNVQTRNGVERASIPMEHASFAENMFRTPDPLPKNPSIIGGCKTALQNGALRLLVTAWLDEFDDRKGFQNASERNPRNFVDFIRSPFRPIPPDHL